MRNEFSTKRSVTRLLLALTLAGGASVWMVGSAQGIQPGRWVHTTEADYSAGKAERVLVTNLGDVKLAMQTQPLGQLPEQAGMISDIQLMPNGDLYLAAGPDAGKLLRKRGDKIEEVATVKGEQIFSLDIDPKGRLLVAVSGAKSRVCVLDNDKLKMLIELPDVRYIWDMAVDRGRVILATGVDGRVLSVDIAKAEANPPAPATAAASAPATAPAGAPTTAPATGKAATKAAASQPEKFVHPALIELLDAKQSNVLCLGLDKQGRIYAGTDTDGLVYRITLNPDGTPAEAFVLYDAGEPEIGALLVTPEGVVYAGTADADQARPGRLGEAAATEAGRPEVPEGNKAEPAKPGDIPNVPPSPPPVKADKKSTPAPGPAPAPAPKKPADKPEEKGKTESKPASAAHVQHATRTLASPHKLTAEDGDDMPADFVPHDEDDAEESPAKPTPEQLDELRETVRQRLEQAKQQGALAGPPRTIRRNRPTAKPMPGPQGKPPGPNTGPTREGNAIYRISPDGFVNEVFRESVMILKLMEDPSGPGKLLVATGNEGKVFRVDPVAGETTIVADIESQQIPAMLKGANGEVILGTANPASLVRLDAGFAKDGTLVGPVLDASQASLWGAFNITAQAPKGTSVLIETRSGNVHDPDQAAWSPWVKAGVLEHNPNAAPLAPASFKIASPSARFMQYRLTLRGDGAATPVVDRVELAYVMPNLRPVINAIQASYPGGEPGGAAPGNAPAAGPRPPGPSGPRPSRPGPASGGGADEPEPQTSLNIEWEASDPNGDRLKHKLEYQPAGSKQWILIAKDLDANNFEWQTRRVPDGRYLLRVTSTDSPDNTPETALTASRQSDPVLVDNTPPMFEKVAAKVEKNVATITGGAADALSPIKAIHYALDSADQWKPVLPDDGLYDSTSEAFTIKLSDLSPGPHVVTLRVTDARNNPRYESVMIEVK